MNFLDKLKEFRDRIFGKKQKRLNAPGKNTADKRNTNPSNIETEKTEYNEIPNTLDAYTVDPNSINHNFVRPVPVQEEIIRPDSIEGAIEQYLNCLLYHRQQNKRISSYGALTSIGGIVDTMNPGRNLENENVVLNNLKSDSRYVVQEQKSTDGRPAFYHVIKGKNHRTNDIKERLYLNCRRENVALLANELLKELDGLDSVYFKFDSDEQMQKTSRPEKFVFYLTNEPKELDAIVNGIEKVKARRPELFKDSNVKNPFLQSFGNIMYASQPQTDEYKALDGTTQKVSKSYNSFLATALNDAYYQAIRETVAKDYKLAGKINGVVFNNSEMYTFSSLEDIMESPNDKKVLFENMKKNLQICMQKNPVLDIKGLQPVQALPNQENVNIATNQQTGNIRQNQYNDDGR